MSPEEPESAESVVTGTGLKAAMLSGCEVVVSSPWEKRTARGDVLSADMFLIRQPCSSRVGRGGNNKAGAAVGRDCGFALESWLRWPPANERVQD